MRVLKQEKPEQKKYYQPVEEEEPSFDSLDYKLSNEFFEFIFIYTLVINLTDVSTAKHHLGIIISKLIFIYTLVINLTNVSTVEKDLIKAVISKLMFDTQS